MYFAHEENRSIATMSEDVLFILEARGRFFVKFSRNISLALYLPLQKFLSGIPTMLSLLDSNGGLSSLSSKLKTSMLALLARRTPAELGELPLSSEEDFFITHRAIKLEFIDLEESVINRTVHKSENGGPAQFSPKLFVLIFQVQTFNFD